MREIQDTNAGEHGWRIALIAIVGVHRKSILTSRRGKLAMAFAVWKLQLALLWGLAAVERFSCQSKTCVGTKMRLQYYYSSKSVSSPAMGSYGSAPLVI
jgi:hypothetical protein